MNIHNNSSVILPRLLKHALSYAMVLMLALGSATAMAQKFSVNFKDAEISELIKFVADSTGKTIVVDPKVKGKVQVVSSKPLSEDELFDLFLSVLDINGFTAIDAGGIVRIVPNRSAKTQPIPVSETRSRKSDSEFQTQVIQIYNADATQLISVLRPMVPPEAHLAAYGDSNVIVITDTAANIARIRQVISRLDNASNEETEVIRLQNASATEAAKTLEDLQKAELGGGKGKKGSIASQNKAQIVADARTNSLLVTGSKSARERIRALAIRIDSPVQHLGGARVIRLKHAKAADLVKVLTKVAESNNVKDARKTVIQADESTNAVILSGSADMVQTLAGVINQLDVRRSQVLIEAIIVEIGDDDARELGIDWLFADPDKGFGTSGGSAQGNLLAASGGITTGSSTVSELAALGGVLGSFANPLFGAARFRDSGTSFVALLNALRRNTKTNILSTPSILTLDNNEAEIVVGQEVPFVTGSYTSGNNSVGNPFQTITRENVGLTLKVTPHIGDGGNITLDLLQEVSSVNPSTEASDVVTNERKIQTMISTEDGQVVVLGGLVQDEITESQSKVPLLGDIPILGRVFKSDETGVKKSHLMVFIRPTIVNSALRAERISRNRYESIRQDQSIKRDVDGVKLYKDNVMSVLPAYDSQVNSEQQVQHRDNPYYVKKQSKQKQPKQKRSFFKKKPKQQEVYQPPVRASQPMRQPVYVPPAPVSTPPSRSSDDWVPEGFQRVDQLSSSSNNYRAPAPVSRQSQDVYQAPTPSYAPPPVVTPPNDIDLNRAPSNVEPIIPFQNGDSNAQSEAEALDQLYRDIDY